jgi:GNAT superfamily N-acetyltransferase
VRTITVSKATTTEQRDLCAALLATDPDLNHVETEFSVMWAAVDEKGTVVGMAGLEMDGEDAHMTFCVVSPEARGRGIQRRLIKARVAWAKRQGLRRVSTYAHVRNSYSLCNLLRCGFVPVEVTDEFLTVERLL